MASSALEILNGWYYLKQTIEKGTVNLIELNNIYMNNHVPAYYNSFSYRRQSAPQDLSYCERSQVLMEYCWDNVVERNDGDFLSLRPQRWFIQPLSPSYHHRWAKLPITIENRGIIVSQDSFKASSKVFSIAFDALSASFARRLVSTNEGLDHAQTAHRK